MGWTRSIYRIMRLPAGATAACLWVSAALAQSPADFYAGKNIEFIIGYTVGAAYDSNGRVVARHIGKYIPGKPNVVVRNMPGAGSLVSTNHLYNLAVRDGTVVAMFSRGNAMFPLLENGAKFDAKKLNWIGSTSKETSLVISWGNTSFKSVEDLRRDEMVVGATGAGADTIVMPAILNATIGTRIKAVTGYPGNSEALLALERGEVQGNAATSIGSVRASRPDWLTTPGQINILLQLGLEKHPTMFKDIPLALDLARDKVNKQALELVLSRQSMAYPIAAPPGVPADRIAALRQAFMQTMKDPEFKADLEKAGFELNPVSGEQIASIIRRIYAAPKEAIERARAAVASPSK